MAFTRIKTEQEIEVMRAGGRILAEILDLAETQVKAGVSTKDLADFMTFEAKKRHAKPALLGFLGYPETACISINNEVVHGVPFSKKIIKNGDLVSLDFTIKYKGLIVDTCRTLFVGDQAKMPADIKKLLNGTKLALEAGISVIKGPTKVGDIASAIQNVLDNHKLGIVKDLVGHGLGDSVHEDPNIPNYGHKGTGVLLKPGMTIAIEPMATLGDWRVNILSDGWTVVTRDDSLSAHFEHTVLITDTGAEVLTAC